MDKTLYNEEELIKKASGGDSEAFGRLVEKYEGMVYNIIIGDIGRCEDAYDISQEVFIKAYRSINSFRGDCKFSTWIYRICINACRDYIRYKSKDKYISMSEYDENTYERQLDIADDVSKEPESISERKEKIEYVRLAISSLNPIHRRIIILRDIEGYSYDEISEMLSLEEGTVKSRINRARHAIKDFLSQRNILE